MTELTDVDRSLIEAAKELADLAEDKTMPWHPNWVRVGRVDLRRYAAMLQAAAVADPYACGTCGHDLDCHGMNGPGSGYDTCFDTNGDELHCACEGTWVRPNLP